FYEDNGGIPGAVIESFSNVAPNSQIAFGDAFGFTAYEIEFTLPSAVELDAGTYWIGIKTTEGTEGDTNYWIISYEGVGAAGHYTTDGGATWTQNTSAYDFAFKLEGVCENGGASGGTGET